MADLSDLLSLDWAVTELPEDFEPLDCIVLVKGVYKTDDGSLTRPVWATRWTRAMSQNPTEQVGAFEVARRLAMRCALDDYSDDEID